MEKRPITGWYMAAAVVFIILGMFAIIEPGVAGLEVTFLVGWLLTFSGVSHLIGARKRSRKKKIISHSFIGVVYIVGGLYALTHSHLPIGTLTLVLAGVILTGGLLEIISYFRLRDEDTSGWTLLNGMITLMLGGMIWFHWPSSSVWAIGILLGVNLLMTGIARLVLGIVARRRMEHIAGWDHRCTYPRGDY